MAIRRIVFKDYVADPSGLIVYSCSAAAAFATVEDLMYNLQYGPYTQVCSGVDSGAWTLTLKACFLKLKHPYYSPSGIGTAIVRAFVSVPLHCATGLIIGISLADRRFFHQDTERWCDVGVLPRMKIA